MSSPNPPHTVESGHTPGPWRDEPCHASDDPVLANIGGDDFIVVCADEFSTVQQAANARLIAAAPDLLAVAKAAMAFINSHVADPDITEEMAKRYAALVALDPDAALRRTTGEN